MKRIATAANVVVPALLVLEQMGFKMSFTGSLLTAIRGDETYAGEDPVAVLGLVKLVEARGWHWRASDQDIERAIKQYGLG
jgi:hypothetical protein